MRDLTKKAKAAIAASAAGLAAIAVGVGVWQPWKQPEPEEPPAPPRQEEVKPQTPEAGDALLHEADFALAEGEALTVRLYGREPRAETGSAAETSYSVSQAEILRNGAVVQTLSPGGYTECPDPDGGLELRDLDGDGYTDLALLEFLPAHNRPMLCWLWDKEGGQFRYAGCVLDPEPGEEPGQVLGRSQDHAGAVRYIETYEVGEDGLLFLVKRVTEDYREDPTGKSPKVTEESFSPGET